MQGIARPWPYQQLGQAAFFNYRANWRAIDHYNFASVIFSVVAQLISLSVGELYSHQEHVDVTFDCAAIQLHCRALSRH